MFNIVKIMVKVIYNVNDREGDFNLPIRIDMLIILTLQYQLGELDMSMAC